MIYIHHARRNHGTLAGLSRIVPIACSRHEPADCCNAARAMQGDT